ncbi:hypothetical protein BJY04DRAFT_221499 [Aspergillus karnatakaensis]|uniref:uncharacterized protein n=1 Tax=Aspergillus karnatakaensis TaxID=1810916 RepID=UPI003CCD53BB
MSDNSFMPQICLDASRKAGIPSLANSASHEDRVRSSNAFSSAFLRYLGGEHLLPYFLRYMCPHPVLVPNTFMANLKEFHVALSAALTNIVQRWVIDEEADLPSRMPLEPHEEDILRWIDKITQDKLFPAYDGRQGNWRPDFLLPANEAGGFKVCEINARFPSNGLDLNARVNRAMDNSEFKPAYLDVEGDPDHMMDRLEALFHPEWSLQFVHNREHNLLIEALMRDLGHMKPRLLTPDVLHLVADKTSPTGYKLQCVREPGSSADPDNNDPMEDIHQVALRLFLDEFAALSPEMQRQLAFLSNNDIRSMLLIHDKRILGILLQELDDLVIKHNILTPRQADLLRKGVVPTITPGSRELDQLIDSYHQGKVSQKDFILKPIRSGRGEGILVGQDLSTAEWETILADMKKSAALGPNRTLYIIQPFVEQLEADMFLDEEMGVQATRRVGTYHSIHGEFVALGMWRVGMSKDPTINMTTGGAWKMASMVTKMN